MNAIICARYPSQSRHKQSILRGPAQGLPHLRGGEGYMVIHKEGHSRYYIPGGSGTKPASRQAPTFFQFALKNPVCSGRFYFCGQHIEKGCSSLAATAPNR